MKEASKLAAGRILVVCAEPPWPATHGGRVDIWNRYEGLKHQGWTAGLICWSDGDGPEAAAAMGFNNVFDWVRLLDRPRSVVALVGRLWRLTHLPSLVGAMHLDRGEMDDLQAEARRFNPDIVVSESVHAAAFARHIARALRVPLVIRSHNIEHKYMAIQYRLATSWRTRLSIAAALLHLKAFEIDALKRADRVLEISKDALPFWSRYGIKRVDWVPTIVPMLERVKRTITPWAERNYDAVYLGNLWSPNNIAAVRWLVDEVMPHVRRQSPNFRLLIAGSKPSAELQAELTGAANVALLANPEDAAVVRASGRVLVNPILEGSGLNTKSIEMLFFDSPLVMTPFAAEGMDIETQACFDLEAGPEGFAAAMIRLAEAPFKLDEMRRQARERFGKAGAARLSATLEDVVVKGRGRI